MAPESPSETRARWALNLIPAVLAALVIAGFLAYYAREQGAIEGAVRAELAAIVEGKVAQIAHWRRERLGDGRMIMASPTIDLCRKLLDGSAGPQDRERLTRAMAELQEQFLYSGAALVSATGDVVYRDPPDCPVSTRATEFAQAAAWRSDVALEDLYLDTRSGRAAMALVVPVTGKGALILDIDPRRFLYPLLASWPGQTKTGEALLVRRLSGNDVEYLSDLRYRPGQGFLFRRTIQVPIPSESTLEQGWQWREADYRGVLTIGTARHVPNSPWYVTVKLDAAEADIPARRLEWQMAVGLLLLGAATLALGGLLQRARQLRARQEQDRWFQTVANETPAFLWMVFPSSRRVFLNRSLSRYLGATGDTVWPDLTDYIHPDDRGAARLRFLRRLGRRAEYSAELRLRRYDGQYRWVACHALPRFSPAGEFLGYAGSVEEIDERVKAERQLRATNAALAHELEDRTRHEKEIASLSARLMTAQEEERKSLARELHDGLSQQIAALSLATANVQRRMPPDAENARAELGRLRDKMSAAAETIRLLSHHLHPAALEHAGLVPALRAYCEELEELTGVHVEVLTEGNLAAIPKPVALGLYRIAQEALQNVAKHSGVKAAKIELRRRGADLTLIVSDEGAGMSQRDSAIPSGIGIVSMRERTRLIGGTLDIATAPGARTSITVEVKQSAFHGAAAG